MKTIQLILRIIVSPIILILCLFVITIIPIGFLCFVVGMGSIIGKLLGMQIDEGWEELFLMTFMIILFPLESTYLWIIEAKLLEYEVN